MVLLVQFMDENFLSYKLLKSVKEKLLRIMH